MSPLEIYAGPTALEQIRQHGFKADLFDFMLGASGGPKWFVLAGLDRVIAPDFFSGRDKPLNILGSSAGAFRFACYGQKDPLAAINRLAKQYSHTRYSDKPDAAEITQHAHILLDYVLGEQGVEEILSNPVIKAHFVVARCRHLTGVEKSWLQLPAILASAGANYIKRQWLEGFYQRYVFSSPNSDLPLHDPDHMAINRVTMTRDNLQAALLASGSIPVVLEGVKDIPSAPPGMYRDGGIIDYHFDLSLGRKEQGLVLYPHFWPQPAPGWFDKSRGARRPHADSYDKVVMLVPSQEFVQSLPYGKIPDRKDFEQMDADRRIAYWQTVLSETDRLGEAFMHMAADDNIAQRIKPIGFTRRSSGCCC